MASSSSKEIKSKIVSVRLIDKEEPLNTPIVITDVKLPDDAPARVKTLRAEGKKWYITVVYLPESETPYAIFTTTNHKEKTAQVSDAVERLIALSEKVGILKEHIDRLVDKISTDNNTNKLTRTLSLLLRHNVPIKYIVNELDKMEDIYVGSFLFQIKKFLSAYIKEGDKVDGVTCKECGSGNMIYTEGCMTCADCGVGHCG